MTRHRRQLTNVVPQRDQGMSIQPFETSARPQIAKDLPWGERGKLAGRLLGNWVSEGDLNALERLFEFTDILGRDAIRKAAAGASLNGFAQRSRLRLLLGSS